MFIIPCIILYRIITATITAKTAKLATANGSVFALNLKFKHFSNLSEHVGDERKAVTAQITKDIEEARDIVITMFMCR